MFLLRKRAAGLAAVALLLTWLTPALTRGAPQLPAPLTRSFTLLDSLETSLEGRRWEEALRHLKEFQGLTVETASHSKGKADENFLYHAAYKCGRLEAALRMRDRDRSEDYYRDLHDLYLRLANSIAPGEPPGLDAILNYIREAEDWNGKANYREVIYELREISRYFRGVYPMLEAEGVGHTKIWEFHGEINRAMAAAEVGSAERTASSLSRLNDMAEGFRELFGVARVKEDGERR